MIEITNKGKSPIQLLIKSRTKPRSFTCLNIPGVGSGNNVRRIEDERYTDHIKKFEDRKEIVVKKIINKG